MSQYFKVKPMDVHHETIAGETVIVHLATGKYYSLKGVATSIWNRIETGASEDQLLEYIGQRYNQPSHAIKNEIIAFLAKLNNEQLIEPHEGTPENLAQATDPGPAGTGYEAPGIEVYSDMQELLLVDPVHDVEHTGWPDTKEESN